MVDAKYLEVVKTLREMGDGPGRHAQRRAVAVQPVRNVPGKCGGKFWFPNYSGSDETLNSKGLAIRFASSSSGRTLSLHQPRRPRCPRACGSGAPPAKAIAVLAEIFAWLTAQLLQYAGNSSSDSSRNSGWGRRAGAFRWVRAENADGTHHRRVAHLDILRGIAEYTQTADELHLAKSHAERPDAVFCAAYRRCQNARGEKRGQTKFAQLAGDAIANRRW